MPLNMANLQTRIATVVVPFDEEGEGEEATVTYRPNVMTPNLEARLNASDPENEEERESFTEIFCLVVADLGIPGPLLDLEDVDSNGNPRQVIGPGEEIPVEPELMGHMPSRVLGKIMRAVMEDMRETDPKQRKSTSRGGSFSRRR